VAAQVAILLLVLLLLVTMAHYNNSSVVHQVHHHLLFLLAAVCKVCEPLYHTSIDLECTLGTGVEADMLSAAKLYTYHECTVHVICSAVAYL
jgi:hypothetical protein